MPIGKGVQWLAIVVALLTSACASTGAVPRPFPMPSTAARTPDATPERPAPTIEPSPTPHGFDAYALVGTALSLRGTPYRNGGSDPNGFDCSGFTQYVFAQYGLSLPREVREQFRQGNPVDSRDLEPGDLVFFSTTDPSASHVAIVVGGDQFIHAPSSTGVVRVEHLGASYWSRRYIGARRVGN
jgi:cell wall-associated NlpC family hydrolase